MASLFSSVPAPRGEWNPSGGRARATRCKPSCCKTPLGHSTVRDHLPETDDNACKCHPKEPA